MAISFEDVSSLVTSQIVSGEKNGLFHMEWDNLNQVTTNIHGNNVANHTKGIMIQEVKRDINMNATIQERLLHLYNMTDSRRVGTRVAEKIPPFHLYKKVGPKFPDTETYKYIN